MFPDFGFLFGGIARIASVSMVLGSWDRWGSGHLDRPIPGRSFVPFEAKEAKDRKQRKRSTSARWIAEAAARAPPEHSLELPDRAASHSAPPSAEMMLMMLSMCHKSCTNAMVRYSVSWETQSTSANFSKIQASSCLGERGQVTWNVLRRMCA